MREGASEAALLKEYELASQQFRALADIRFKLLAFTPLGTVGVLSAIGSLKVEPLAVPISLFGCLVTLAIFVYNLRNDQHYDELVSRAAQIERQLLLFDGSFVQRPRPFHRLLPGVDVEHRWPIDLIYVASAVLWLWAAVAAQWPHMVLWKYEIGLLATVVLIAAIMGYLYLSRWLSKRKYRRAVDEAMDFLVGAVQGPDATRCAAEAAAALARTLGGKEKSYVARIHTFLRSDIAGEYVPQTDLHQTNERAAAYVLAQVIGMPARWILDIYTGKRG